MQLFQIMIPKNELKTLNAKNKTPLHYAAKTNSKEICELLISKGADVNAFDIICQKILTLLLFNIIENK